MNNFYTKALALLALGCSALGANAGVHETTGYIPEDRSGWKISGCSQCNEAAGNGNDGGFAQMIDDNINTFWHSNWQNGGDNGPGHYFIIDRGENAPEIKYFGYTPRQGATGGNGYVTAGRLFAVDEAPAFSVCSGSWTTAPGYTTGEGDDAVTVSAHDHAAEWFNANTPLVSATFDCKYNDASTHNEYIVELPTPTSARYLIFVVDDASGSQGNKFANCSEFKTYTDYGTYTYEIVEASDFEGKRIMLLNKMHQQYIGVKSDANGNIFTGNTGYGIEAIWTLVPGATEGKYMLHNEYYNYYVAKMVSALNTRIPAVEDVAEAGEWVIDFPGNGEFGVISTTDYPNNNCFHMVNWDGIVRWNAAADASQFSFVEVGADDYATWVEAYANLCPATIGYHAPSEEYQQALETLRNDPENLDNYYPVAVAAAAAPVVLPAEGKYYTIRGAHESFQNHFITESYDRQVDVTVGSGDDAVTDKYNEVIVANPSANILPQLWSFSQITEGDHAGNYIITAANSGSALRCPNWATALAALPQDHSDVGHYTILDESNRQFGGVTLVSPNSADKGTANINGEGPSFNSWNGTSNGNNWFIEAVDAVPVSFNGDGYAAVQYPFAVSVPEGVTVYTVVATDAEHASLKSVDWTVIPSNVPVVLRSAEDTASLTIVPSADEPEAPAEAASLLKGTNLPAVVENAFILDGAYLVRANGGAVPANSAYVVSDTEGDDLELNYVVTGIKLSETELSLGIGESATLVATVEPADAVAEVTWTSSDAAVATVDRNGNVVAVAEGTATITATCEEFSATCTVTVLAPAPVVAETVTLDKTALELKAGETATLVATVLPEDAEDKTVVWTSSDEAVATVSAEGVVTAVAEGTATITATCGDVKAECVVTVTADIEDLLDEIRANAAAVGVYDLSGRRVLNPAQGVYILRRNGKTLKVTL